MVTHLTFPYFTNSNFGHQCDFPLLGNTNFLIIQTSQAVLSAIFYAAFVLMLRQANHGFSAPPTGPLFDSTVGTALTTLIIGLAFAPDFDLAITWPAHGWILLMAIGSQVVGWLLISLSLPRLPALDTSVLLLGQPMLAVLWARLFYDEALGVSQWVGAGIVLAGLAIFSLRKTNGTSDDTRQEPIEPTSKPA